MGVYIKGMEMPIFEHQSWDIRKGTDGKWYMVDTNAETSDGAWHEIVPVPPHGRLIDADALADIFRGFIALYDTCPFNQLSLSDKSRRDELQAALAEVINAPTVIPAEEGET